MTWGTGAVPPTLDVYGMTDVGRKRTNNEDHFFVASLHKTLTLRQTSLDDVDPFQDAAHSGAELLMVADGVGGVAGGELASGLAVATVGELVAQTAGCFYNFDVAREHEFLDQLERAVVRTHEVVSESFGGRGRGPATTLTVVTVVWPRAYIIHVGDSRCYYLHNGRLRQITRDQTMSEMLIDEGAMTEDQAANSRLAHVLASAIGGDIQPTQGLVDLAEDDALLLCTDGLTKHVTDDQIRDILEAMDTPETACRALVDAALEGGGSDNVTAIVARYPTTPGSAAGGA